jgi:outer membrane protein assembly factor BamA
MNRNNIKIYSCFLPFVILLTICACSSLKKNQGKILLTKTKLEINNNALDYYDINGLIKQHENRRFIGIRLHTGVYNLGKSMKDRTKIKENKILNKIQRKKRKHPNKYINEQKELEKVNKGLRNWLMNTVGEEPVFLDSASTRQSVSQIELYCNKHGFFNNQVYDTIILNKRKNKARVEYKINAGNPYTINKIDFYSSDNEISSYFISGKANSLLKKGDIYNEDLLENERMRINEDLKNLGYYAFSKSYIRYEIDSALGNNTLNIKVIINRPFVSKDGQTEFYNHQKYKVRRVYVLPEYSIVGEKSIKYDTLKHVKQFKNKREFDTLYFLYNEPMRVNPQVIARKIFIRPDVFFSLATANKSQAELSSLNIFKYINIRFAPDTIGNDLNNVVPLDAFIELSLTPVQALNFEIEGTNSSGNVGTAGNLVYKNRNLFHGAEQFNFKFKGGLELQKTIFEKENDVIGGLPFNSAEISSEIGLSTPVNSRWFTQSSHPMMKYSTGFSYQLRPDYQRYISHLKASIEWRESAKSIYQIYLPINLVRILPDSMFAERISQFSRTIRYSYEDHFIPGSGLTITSSTQALRKNKPYSYSKITLEQAGLMLWLGNGFNSAKKGEIFRVLGINYSQYAKVDLDFRHYIPYPNQTVLAGRAFLGIGFPYGNSILLPFEKSYSASGSNDIRAWKFRSLGPGSFSDSTLFDCTGDISLVLNLEYRFPIISLFNGALFVDAGNVWLKNASDEFPGGEFKIPDFYKQIGIGTGLGLRLDFSFFVFRVDASFPLRNPTLPENNRWVGFNKPLKRTNLNFGIGYPF